MSGKKVEAEKLNKKISAAFAPLQAAGSKTKSIYIELYAPWKSPAADGYTGQILKAAGGKLSVAASRGGTVSPEVVAMAKPELIFFVENSGSAQEISTRAALADTPAVKNKRIYPIPRKLLCEGVAPIELLNFLSDKIKDL